LATVGSASGMIRGLPPYGNYGPGEIQNNIKLNSIDPECRKYASGTELKQYTELK